MMNSPINMFVCHIDGVVLTVNIAIILFEYSPFYRHSRSSFVMSFVEIVLNDTLQQAQVGRPVLDLARSFVCYHFSHAPPSFDVAAAKHFISPSLTDKFRVVVV